MKDLLEEAMQRKLCNKKKNVKYGGPDKDNLKSSLQTCNNKYRKQLNKVAFLSGLPRFDVKKNDTLGPGRKKNNCYSIIILYKTIFFKVYFMSKLNLFL